MRNSRSKSNPLIDLRGRSGPGRARRAVVNRGGEIMAKALALHEGVIRPGLVAELEAFRAPGRRVSSYYLDLDPGPGANVEAARLAVKVALAKDRERLEELEGQPALRHALHRDWDLSHELALGAVGKRRTRSLASFVPPPTGSP